jgi:LytS/YehU family sensor histidine kinase
MPISEDRCDELTPLANPMVGRTVAFIDGLVRTVTEDPHEQRVMIGAILMGVVALHLTRYLPEPRRRQGEHLLRCAQGLAAQLRGEPEVH